MAARLPSQDATGTSTTGSVSATYAATPTAGNMLLAGVFSTRPPGTNTISGWTLLYEAGMQSSTKSVSLFAKLADGTESTTVSATMTSSTNSRICLLEVAGLRCVEPAMAVWGAAALANQAAATARNNSAIASFSPTQRLNPTPTWWISILGSNVATSGASWNRATAAISTNDRLAVSVEETDGPHDAHVTYSMPYTTHNGTWSWTGSSAHGVIDVGFYEEFATMPMMGMGPT